RRSAVVQPRNYAFLAMLRLKPGQSLAAGTAAARALQPGVVAATGPQFAREPFTLAPAWRGATGVAGLRQKFTRPLLTLLAVVALVLVVACVNIANLLLARAAGRRHELSVHAALGATRWRLARGPLAESLVLAGLGAILGLGLAVWGSHLFVAELSTPTNRIVLDQSVDWRVALFTVAIGVATALLFGVVPAVRATRAAPIDALKSAARGTSSGSTPFTSALVVVQVA